ncbi:MAG: energy transducer TonB [Bacteroidales bacterium]
MLLKVDLYSKAWADVVFENRNHKYGAYELRTTTPSREWLSLLIAISLFLALFSVPLLFRHQAVPPKLIDNRVRVVSSIVIEQPKPEEIFIPKSSKAADFRASEKFVNPLIVRNEQVPIDEKMPTQLELNKDNIAIGTVTHQGPDNAGLNLAKTEEASNGGNSNEIQNFVEEMPQFPGGERALARYLNGTIHYPFSAQEQGISGLVVCEFVINQDGRVCNIRVLKGVCEAIDEEAMRVISRMPAWKPGIQQGRAVRVRYTLPITFAMSQSDN